jgi:CheY-like chemotaxis protein
MTSITLQEDTGELNLLLVEDDEVDRRAVKRAFDNLSIPVNIVEACDGLQALAILEGKSDTALPPRPFVILLDINLPQMDGIELLERLRSEDTNPALRNSIVFVMTTSDALQDRERAYAQHIAGYLMKSNERGGLQAIVELLKAYRHVVVFP